MQPKKLIAPYHLGLDDQSRLYEVNGKPFDTKSYSRMKYGIQTDLKNFATILCTELRQRAPELYSGLRKPAILTSYKSAAPPATTLARYCLDIINLARLDTNLPPGEMVQVYRPQDYIQEYAVLPAAERKKLIGGQTANSLRGRRLDDYQPVILDDIRVTGTYAGMMQEIVQRPDTIAVYLVICDNSLKDSPHAENELNTSEIRTPSDLLPFIKRGDFVCTRRFLKMLLRTQIAELRTVLSELPASLLDELARNIVDTGDNLTGIFPDTCPLIVEAARQKRFAR